MLISHHAESFTVLQSTAADAHGPFANPPTAEGPTRDGRAIRDHWNSRSFDFNGVHPRLRLIASMIERLPGVSTMLDIGCGPAPLRSAIPPRIEYFGVDIASAVIDAMGDPSHFEAVDLDERQEAFGDRRFDLVVCSGVFEYINERRKFMEFLGAKAAPGGWMIFSFTNHQHRVDGLHWLRGDYHMYRDPHVNFMLVPQVMQTLRAFGWRIVERHALTAGGREYRVLRRFVHFPLNVLNRNYVFLCRRSGAAATAPASPALPASGAH